MNTTLEDDGLATLAKSLTSEYDRKRYIKVIEMSNTIRSKLAVLQEEKQRSSLDTRHTLVNEPTSIWSFSDIVYDHHRSSSQSIASDNTTIATMNSHCGDDVIKSYLDETTFLNASMSLPTRHHTYQVIDQATSLKMRSEFSKKPSTDALFHKPTIVTLKSTFNHNKQRLSCDSTSSSEVEFPSTIHVAVRKDASLYKIEKKETPQKLLVDGGLLTPPDSPQFMRDSTLTTSFELTRITPIYKKSSKLLRRSCQLNQYTMTKSTTTSPLSVSSLLFFRATNTVDGRHKWILKVTIVSLERNTPEPQKRFGFTFWSHHQNHRATIEESKFAIAPDSLVQEALSTWIDSQGALPCLSKADDILRDGKKIYVIYDTDLF